jgi:hypothetical protein
VNERSYYQVEFHDPGAQYADRSEVYADGWVRASAANSLTPEGAKRSLEGLKRQFPGHTYRVTRVVEQRIPIYV